MRLQVRTQVWAYSLDPHQKVVAALERGRFNIEEVTASFSVGLTFSEKLLHRQREVNDFRPVRTKAVSTRLSAKPSNCLTRGWAFISCGPISR